MSNNNGASNNLRAFLGQIWGGISFAIAVVTSLLGWIQVARGDLGLFTLILLLVSVSALFLACVYYVWFWKPESEDGSPKILIPDSNKAIKIQRVKQQRRKKVRLLARLGLFIIPILTVAGIAGWQYYVSRPTQDFIILVAKFDGPKPQEYRVTETIVANLENATEEYSHVKIEALEKSLNNKSNARKEGKRQKAALVIWGWYGKTEEKVPISVNFELLNSSPKLPKLGREARGQVQTLAVAQLESFKLQTRLSQEMTYLSLFTLGMYRYLEGDWDRAIERFTEALAALESAEEPVAALGREIVYFHRGASYLQEDSLQAIDDYFISNINLIKTESGFLLDNSRLDPSKYQRIIDDYNKALIINPQFALAYLNRGLAYFSQGDYQRAIDDYNKALKINPQSALAYSNRGLAYLSRGDYQQAIDDFNQVLKIDPQFANAYLNRGIAYLARRDYQQAIDDFNRVLKIDPQFANAYLNRGSAYDEQGDYQQAIDDYNRALKINPQSANAYLNRGTAYQKQGNYQQAIDDYNQALKINPQSALPYSNRGAAYFKQRDYQRAIDDFNQVIQTNPQLAIPYMNRGVAYKEQGNYQRAIDDYNRALKINPQFAEGYSNRGLAYKKQGNYQQAIDDQNQALKINPQFAEAYSIRGETYHKQENYTAALNNYQQALDKNEKHLPAIANIGLIQYEQGSIDEAIRQWQQAVKIDPNRPEPKIALAVALYVRGERKKAFKMAKAALKLDRQFAELEHLKKNLWGKRMLADAEKLLSTPRIQGFLSSSQP